jgi:hypothetical protein
LGIQHRHPRRRIHRLRREQRRSRVLEPLIAREVPSDDTQFV